MSCKRIELAPDNQSSRPRTSQPRRSSFFANSRRSPSASFSGPVDTERFQPSDGFPIFSPIRGALAGDDIVQMANGETFYFDAPAPGILEIVDAIRRKDKIKIEGAVLQLNEILSPKHLLLFGRRKRESQLAQGHSEPGTVFQSLIDIEIRILGGVRVAEKDRARFAEKKIPHFVGRKHNLNLLSLTIFKGRHMILVATVSQPLR